MFEIICVDEGEIEEQLIIKLNGKIVFNSYFEEIGFEGMAAVEEVVLNIGKELNLKVK